MTAAVEADNLLNTVRQVCFSDMTLEVEFGGQAGASRSAAYGWPFVLASPIRRTTDTLRPSKSTA